MNSLQWPRIILCGFIVGVVFTLMTAVLVDVLGKEFLSAVGAHAANGNGTAKTGFAVYVATVLPGLWAMWLYAVFRPLFTTTFRAVIAVGLAWWVLASIQSVKWILLLDIPIGACLPLAANLIPTVIAVYAGAVVFGAVQPDQALQPTPDGAAERRR